VPQGPPAIRPIEIRRESPNVWIDGTSVVVTWHSPNSYVAHPFFECPACGRRCRHLYLRDTIACRRCHRLDWACRHVNRQMPSVARVARLRRHLGAADTRPFAPLPPRKRGQRRARYEQIVARIHAEEAKLVAYLGGIVYDLDRRQRVHRERKRHDKTPRSDTASS
jgi:hypothetical protein